MRRRTRTVLGVLVLLGIINGAAFARDVRLAENGKSRCLPYRMIRSLTRSDLAGTARSTLPWSTES